jgi:hypothetical protein
LVDSAPWLGLHQEPQIQAKSRADILQKLSDLEGRISDDSFQLGGYTFSSEPELADWCKKEGVVSCGMFWDLFSAMVVMIHKQQVKTELTKITHRRGLLQHSRMTWLLRCLMKGLAACMGKMISWYLSRMVLEHARQGGNGSVVLNPTRLSLAINFEGLWKA